MPDAGSRLCGLDSTSYPMDTPYATRDLQSVSSTQDEARRCFDGVPLLITAAHQTGGRGRSGSVWLEAPRPLFASLAFSPTWQAATWPRLSLVAGLAARDALGGSVGLKWPNDLIGGSGKVGGLLAEAQGDPPLVVLGLGVNLWWPDAPSTIAAVHDADPGPGAAARVAAAWAEGVLGRVGRGPDGWGLDEYTDASVTVGADVEWDSGGPARAVGIDPEGGLIVERDGRRRRLTAGEVRHLRTATLHDLGGESTEVEQ